MRPLSALDAISPAFTRTHNLLFSPFRMGRSWKLSASFYLGFLGSVFIPFPLMLFFLPHHTLSSLSAHRVAFVCSGVFFSALLLAMFYFGARMELVNFEMVVTLQKRIAPMWRGYGSRVWPILWTKVVLGTVLTLALLRPVIVAGRGMMSTLSQMPRPIPGQVQTPAEIQASMALMFHGLLGFYVILYGWFFLLKFFSTLLNDFVVPMYLLEDAPLFAAVRMGAEIVAADPLQVILYLFMKLVLSILGFIAYLVGFLLAELVLLIPLMILVGIGAVISVVAAKALGAAGVVLLVVAGVLLYLAFFVAIMYVNIGMFGYLIALLEAFGIYFLGGRYARLGELLEPSAPPPFRYTPPPSFPSPDEGEDESNDPPLPMDPAIA